MLSILPETLGMLNEKNTNWKDGMDPEDFSEGIVFRRVTSVEDGTPTFELSNPQNSPVGYGGLKYNETKLTRAVVALSDKTWPPWTLLHHRQFELDLDRLERRLWKEDHTLKLRDTSLPFGEGDSWTGGTDIVFLVAR